MDAAAAGLGDGVGDALRAPLWLGGGVRAPLGLVGGAVAALALLSGLLTLSVATVSRAGLRCVLPAIRADTWAALGDHEALVAPLDPTRGVTGVRHFPTLRTELELYNKGHMCICNTPYFQARAVFRRLSHCCPRPAPPVFHGPRLCHG